MALALFHKQCSKNVTGNMYLFLVEAESVYAVEVTSGVVTNISMQTTETFKQIQADRVQRLVNGARVKKSWTNYAHTINFTVGKLDSTVSVLSTALDDAQACGLIAIVMDSNGQAWVVGWSQSEDAARPLYLQSEVTDSGDVPGSNAGNNYTLLGTNDEDDLPCNATINAYILNSIAAGSDLGFTP